MLSYYCKYASLFSLSLSHPPLSFSFLFFFAFCLFLFSLLSTRQIILPGIFFPASTGCGPGEAPFSHLESNRGPLSKKLISLNIILGASGSRRALTDPSVHPHPRPLLTAAKPSCLSPILRFCTANSVPSLSPSPRSSATASLLFTPARFLPPPSLPLIF